MAYAEGGLGGFRGLGGLGQTFTTAQHDKSLGRKSEGPGVKREPDVEDFEEAGAAMEPQVGQATGQGIVGGS